MSPVDPATITLTPFERTHRRAAMDLIYRGGRTHTHLDWHETGAWLDSQNASIKLAWWDDELIGMMAASAPLHDTCWLRLVAVADPAPLRRVLRLLWDELVPDLKAQGVHTVAVLVMNDWISSCIPALGFAYVEHIITLRRDGYDRPPINSGSGVAIRPAEVGDLQAMVVVDQAAFNPPWQLAYEDLYQARRIAAVCTVARVDEQIVGYQLSTLYRHSGHLARLAVSPVAQGRGVGRILLDNLIVRFAQRGVAVITVNTQESNTRSQRLYTHYDFHRTGYDLPVWVSTI
jgi:ribosomal protein S18 acetylase RimI-like enzyme